jgi:hypothetical protein
MKSANIQISNHLSLQYHIEQLKFRQENIGGIKIVTRKISVLLLCCFVFFTIAYLCAEDDDSGFVFNADYCESGKRHVIPINPVVEITALEKEEFWDFRRAYVDEYRHFGIYPTNYSMSDLIRIRIYGSITWGTGWLESTQFFIENPYMFSLTARPPSVLALSIKNKPEVVFIEGCGFEIKFAGKIARKWMDLIFDPKVRYSGAAQLWFVNAADAGFQYASIPTDSCENVNPDWNSGLGGALVDGVYRMKRFFYHYGKYKLNNLSPADSSARFKIIDRDKPLRARIKLWKNEPDDRFATEDMRITLIVDPT